MGVVDFIKKQFIDVIHWTEESDGVLAYRFPMQDAEIQNGAQLTVRDSQMAIFVDEGQIADIFGPGRHTLKTQTLPVLTNLKNWDKLFDSPFKADVYFFSNRIQLNRKWGTSNPITVRDKDFGFVRLRAFGIYSYRVTNPKLFYQQVSGTRAIFSTEEMEGQLRNTIVAGVSDHLGESNIPFVEMAANHDEIGLAVKTKLEPIFSQLGLTQETLVIQNISLPEELQTALDSRIGVNVMGGMQEFTKYQAASSIPLAARNEGGLAGLGAGVGVGLGAGQQIAQAMVAASNPTPSVPPSNSPTSSDEIMVTLEKLHALMTNGVLSKQEFESKKLELLAGLK